MITSELHPLDEVTRFGFTAHGLVTAVGTSFSQTLIVGGEPFPLPYVWPHRASIANREPYDTHLVRVPGIDPVELSPEEAEADAGAGRTWQHYALLSEDELVLYGHVLSGWVCIDPAGQRWLIRTTPHVNYTEVRADQPLEMQVSAVPFGYLGEAPAEPVTQTVTLADIGQGGDLPPPPSGLIDPMRLMTRIGSISSDGRKAVIELHGWRQPSNAATHRINTAPAGFLLLEIGGDGPGFELSLSVLRTRAQALGDYTEERQHPERRGIQFAWSSTSTPGESAGVPGAYIDVALDALEFHEPLIGPGGLRCGAGWRGEERAGRIAALLFDDGDNLVEFSYDATWRVDWNFAESLEGSVSGSATSFLRDDSNATSLQSTGSMDIQVTQSIEELLTGEVTVRRNGQAVASGKWEAARSGAVAINVVNAAIPNIYLQDDGSWVGQSVALPGAYASTSAVTTVSVGPRHVATHPSNSNSLWLTIPDESTVQLAAYGANLDYQVGSGHDHSGATVTLQRYSNNVLGVRLHAKPGLRPGWWYVPTLAAPQATRSNPDSGDVADARRASYHPFTHEIATSAGEAGGFAQPFVWT